MVPLSESTSALESFLRNVKVKCWHSKPIFIVLNKIDLREETNLIEIFQVRAGPNSVLPWNIFARVLFSARRVCFAASSKLMINRY